VPDRVTGAAEIQELCDISYALAQICDRFGIAPSGEDPFVVGSGVSSGENRRTRIAHLAPAPPHHHHHHHELVQDEAPWILPEEV